MSYAIRNEVGTFYAGPSMIGPRFGATEANAKRYATEAEATRVLESHAWAFALCEVVELEDAPRGAGAA